MATVVKINAIEVPPGAGPLMEEKFLSHKSSMDTVPGFLGFQLLRPVKGETRYFVITNWQSQEAFDNWHKNHMSETHNKTDEKIATSASLLEFETVMEVPGSGK